jgi:hypothetical protein
MGLREGSAAGLEHLMDARLPTGPAADDRQVAQNGAFSKQPLARSAGFLLGKGIADPLGVGKRWSLPALAPTGMIIQGETEDAQR